MDNFITSYSTSLPASVNRYGIFTAVLLRDRVKAGHICFAVSEAVHEETSS